MGDLLVRLASRVLVFIFRRLEDGLGLRLRFFPLRKPKTITNIVPAILPGVSREAVDGESFGIFRTELYGQGAVEFAMTGARAKDAVSAVFLTAENFGGAVNVGHFPSALRARTMRLRAVREICHLPPS